ncbi:MAG: hypothetical protein AAGK70_12865 [Pseudomonadota bacterium]
MKSLFRIALAIISFIVAAELFARFAIGFGSPPLLMEHETIDYMFRPNQDVRTFHNRVLINQYGMRSPRFESTSADRVILVFGDSVLNGGSGTDHSELATSIVASEMSNAFRNVFVGNVSAGSWGPGNFVAWINEFGLMDADTVVLVLSSHDLDDQPTFRPLNPVTHPTRRPSSAIIEIVRRYLPRILPSAIGSKLKRKTQPRNVKKSAIRTAKSDLNYILDMAAEQNIGVCVVQHQTQPEITSARDPAFVEITRIFESRSVPTRDMGEAFKSDSDPDRFYRDYIHINPLGQVVLASEISWCIGQSTIPSLTRD